MAVCAALVAYVGVRSWTLSITHDEALTYSWHVTGKLHEVLLFESPGLPDNNHLLLTLLAKGSTFLFGPGELALRLPSVFAYALFCAAVLGILARHLRGALLPLFMLFVASNPYLVDMMSIARGYGLGIAFCTAGTWCLLRDSEPRRCRSARWAGRASLCFALATLSHLTFVLTYALAFGLMVLSRLGACRGGRVTPHRVTMELGVPALLSLALVPFLVRQARILDGAGLLNTEGLTSFHADTVRGVLDGTLYSFDPGVPVYGFLAAAAYALPTAGLLAGAAGLFGLKGHAEGARTHRDLLVLSVLLVGAASLSVAQHHLLGVAYLSARRAVFLYPLFGLVCACLVAALDQRRAGRYRAARLFLLVFATAMVAHFAWSANLRATHDWAYDSRTKAILGEVGRLFPPAGDRPYRLGVSWEFEPAMTHYLRLNGWTWVVPVRLSPEESVGAHHLYYVFDHTLPKVHKAAGDLLILRRYGRWRATLALPASPL